MKTGDKVIVPAEISGYGRDLRAMVTEIEKVRRGNIRNSDIHRTMSGSLRKKRGAFYHDFQLDLLPE